MQVSSAHHKSATAAATEAAFVNHNRPPANATPFSPQHLLQGRVFIPEEHSEPSFFFLERRNRDICRHTSTLICKSHLAPTALRTPLAASAGAASTATRSKFVLRGLSFDALDKADTFDHFHTIFCEFN